MISDPLVLIFLALGTAVCIAVAVIEARHPDPDLQAPWLPEGPMCPKCGARRPPHLHPSWTERNPR